ncbi:MAG: di-trans,poly-cis-decaprenylcistransferase [Clostridiales bacterium]|nr:di-trans,poly-cis-decaprenylcistransferase [Clostridiales bacterium]
MVKGLKKLPKHIGFIIDGNGRWAKERGQTRSMGHKAGFRNLERIIKECFYTYGIPVVSIYAFSTENWNRPQKEVDYLMQLFRQCINEEFRDKYPNVRLNIMGDHTRLDKDLSDACAKVMVETKDITEFTLNLGINYSGKAELTYAFNQMAEEGLKNITAEDIDNHLYTKGQPPLDFCVRTSGENRLSNFMLWQIAYAELYFPEVHWPAFNKRDLYTALKVYQGRDRRFGAIKE